MKHSLLYFFTGLCCLFFATQTVFSQRNLDLGFFGGGSYYQGDINASKIMYAPRPAFGAFVRYAFHTRWALRVNIFSGQLKGNDKDFSYTYQQIRSGNFSTPIIEATGQIELNFLPYRFEDKKKKWTPYVLTGATFLIASYADHVYQPAIPFGLGVKVNISKRLAMGAEWAYRKTFTDGLDNLSGYKKLPETTTNHSVSHYKQFAYFHQKDYYAFMGIFFTYKLNLTDIRCDAYQ